nr:hypothetical protein [Tanacetum cinerariifolium]
VALDESLVPISQRLRIGRSNFRLPSDIQSKESTLQVVYDVLRNSPIFRAFQVTADVPEIYMQEFWATAKLHHTSIRFKIDTKKSILELEAFREMLHISPRIPSQSFAELPTEEEILEFLRNSKAYKEYYACATGEAAPKLKASARKKKGDSAFSTTPPTPTPTTTVVSAPRLSATAKSKQPARAITATAKLHHNSIRFKMDTKKSVLDLEAFREMLHISPRIPSQSSAELPFEEEIMEFLRSLGHSDEIRHLTDVNVNKLYQPWRSFTSVINKCLTGKSSGIDSFRLSQAQILWGFYHRRIVDYAYLIWEDFMYQMEHKNQKRSNEMYYPRFTKVIIDYFMMRKPSIPRRNKINWHYVRDDVLFSTIKVVSRHQTTQQYGAILPIELTTDDIRNNKAYKEYYACATGEAAPKPKASARKKKGDSASSITPPTPTPTTTVVAAPRLSAAAKDEGTGSKPGVPDVPSNDSEEEISWNSFDDEDVDEQTKGRKESEGDKSDESDEGSDDDNDETVKAGSDKDDDDNDDEEELTKKDDKDTESGKGGDEVSESEGESDEEETRQEEEESFDLIPRTPEGSEDESNDEEDQELRISEEQGYKKRKRQMNCIVTSISTREGVYNNDEEDQELRLSEEARIQEEEDVDELYRDVNIHQGRGLQVTQNVEDSDVTLTPVNPDGPQESSSVSSFVTSIREDDDQEGPSAGSNRGSKRQKEGGEHASASIPSETATEVASRSTTG